MTVYRLPDGQYSLSRAEKCNSLNYGFNLLLECVVTAIHYPSDVDNRSGFEIEYDCDPIGLAHPRILGARRIDVASGIDDGDTNILRISKEPGSGSTKLNCDGSGEGTPESDPAATDGDRVLVGFLNGNPRSAVIIGVLTNASTRMALIDVTGRTLPKGGSLYRRMRHRGTELVIDSGGNVSVTFAETPDNSHSDKKMMTISLGDLKFIFDNSGGVPANIRITNDDESRTFFSLEDKKVIVNCDQADIAVDGDATINSTGDVAVTAGGALTLESSGGDVTVKGNSINVEGSIVNVNGSSSVKLAGGGTGVARGGDSLLGTAGPYPIKGIIDISSVSTKVSSG